MGVGQLTVTVGVNPAGVEGVGADEELQGGGSTPEPPPPTGGVVFGSGEVNPGGPSRWIGTYDHEKALHQIAGKSGFIWCSANSTSSLYYPWDRNKAIRDHAPGETVIDLNTVEGLAAGDQFSIESVSQYGVYTIQNVDAVNNRITITPGLRTNGTNPLYAGWKKGMVLGRGGNWRDQDGTFRGSNHYVNEMWVAGNTTQDFNVSAIDGDILIIGNVRASAILLDGQPASAYLLYWTAESYGAFITGSGSPANILVLNPNRASTLTIQRSFTTTTAIRINRVAGPKIQDYVWDDNATWTPPDIWHYEPRSFQQLLDEGWTWFDGSPIKPLSSGQGWDGTSSSYAYGEWGPAYFMKEPVTGMPFMRLSCPGMRNRPYNSTVTYGPNQRAINIEKKFPEREEVYCQVAFLIERDYQDIVNETGVKWLGVHTNSVAGAGITDRMELGSWSFENPGYVLMNDYSYSFEDWNNTSNAPYRPAPDGGAPELRLKTFRQCAMEVDRWYVCEYYVKMNSIVNGVAQPDGIRRYWLNGNIILDATNVKNRGSRPLLWDAFEFAIYHGGRAFPQRVRPGYDWQSLPLWFRVGDIRVSTRYMGRSPFAQVPRPSWPTWRKQRVVDKLIQIPGSKMIPVVPSTNGPTNWSSSAFTPDGRCFNIAQTGHNDSTGDPGPGNGAYSINLMAENPVWTQVHPGTSAANTPLFSTMNSYIEARPNRVYYVDDIRPPVHGYYQQCYVKGTNCFDGEERIIMPGLNSPRAATGGYWRYQTDGYKIGSNTWDARAPDGSTTGVEGVWDDIPAVPSGYPGRTVVPQVCTDRRDGKIYFATGWHIAVFDPLKTNAHWEIAGGCKNGYGGDKKYLFPISNQWTHKGMCIDSTRDRLVTVTGLNIEYFDLAGGELQTIPLVGYTPATVNIQNGLTYDEDNDRYLLLVSPPATTFDELWAIHPVVGEATLLDRRSDYTRQGVMSGFAYIPDLGGCAIITDTDEDLWFVPTRNLP